MIRRAVLALAALSTVATMSCATGRNAGSQANVSPAGQTTAPTPCSVEGATTDAKESESTAPTALVTDVRDKAEDCPRIVFEFRDQESGYKVAYGDPPFSDCGSGKPIPTAGWEAEAFLIVRLMPAASADIEAPGAPATYKGSRDIAVDGKVLKHMAVTCDFEADFSWLIGLDGRHPFAVTTLDNPSRIVIDINEA